MRVAEDWYAKGSLLILVLRQVVNFIGGDVARDGWVAKNNEFIIGVIGRNDRAPISIATTTKCL